MDAGESGLGRGLGCPMGGLYRHWGDGLLGVSGREE